MFEEMVIVNYVFSVDQVLLDLFCLCCDNQGENFFVCVCVVLVQWDCGVNFDSGSGFVYFQCFM